MAPPTRNARGRGDNGGAGLVGSILNFFRPVGPSAGDASAKATTTAASPVDDVGTQAQNRTGDAREAPPSAAATRRTRRPRGTSAVTPVAPPRSPPAPTVTARATRANKRKRDGMTPPEAEISAPESEAGAEEGEEEDSESSDASDHETGASSSRDDSEQDAQVQGPPKVAHEVPLVSEYERKRLERMAMNAQFLQQLGMQKAQSEIHRLVAKPIVKEIKKKRREDPLPVLFKEPSRRSRRLQKLTADGDPVAVETQSTLYDDATPEPEVYDDSSVYRYTAARKVPVPVPRIQVETDENRQPVQGFAMSADSRLMLDSQLKKIYSMDFSPFASNGLIAVGGHQGQVSIYATNSGVAESSDEIVTPLMSFRAHKGWVSSVSLSMSAAGGKNLLLTASNDHTVRLWDLNQASSVGNRQGGVAKALVVGDNLHTNGIFGMDVQGSRVLTASKDSTIVLSSLEESSVFRMVHRFRDHDGVVKCARFSTINEGQFASGGNDRVLRVFDSRVPKTASLEITNANERAINSIAWHPTNAHYIMSASFSPTIHLYDLRQPNLPLFAFHGHYADQRQSTIYHPIFVDGGRYITTPGGATNQELSLYRTEDGSTVSRGHIGMRADYIALDPFGDRILVASGPELQFFDLDRTETEW